MSRREILQLRIKGMICPCLLSAEDRTAKESFDFLTRRKVWHIQWHRPMLLKGLAADTTSSSNGDAATEGGGGFFKKLVSTVVTSTVGPNICNATLRIMENQYGIAIKILKTDKDNKLANRRPGGEQTNGQEGDEEFGIDNEDDDVEDEDDNNNDGKRKNKRRERVILLRNIGSVEPSEKHSNGIVLYGINKSSSTKGSSSSAVGSNDAKGEELLRFDLKAPSNKSNMTDHELKSLRDDMVDHLGVVCKWDRLRHAARIEKERAIQASDSENSTTVLSQEYDEDGTPLPQRNRAQRAAHFARREVELTQTQRDRDAKKQKYLAMSGGGLKYTAVAMAQRAVGE